MLYVPLIRGLARPRAPRRSGGRWRVRVYARQIAARSSTAPCTVSGISGPVDIVRDRDAITARLRGHEARHVLRARLRARAGSAVADGVSAPRRPRPAVRDLRRRDASRRIGFSARSAPAAPRGRRGTRCRLTRRTAGRRATSPASTRSSPRITAGSCRWSSRCSDSSPSRGPVPTCSSWVKMMAWDLSKNYSLELLRHDLAADRRRRTGRAELLPPVPGRRADDPQRRATCPG